jgi:RNA polymerase sigma factor (sigma-70 family)
MMINAAPAGERNREMFFSVVGRHLKGLHHFVRHELAYRESVGDLPRGDVLAEDVVDAVLLRAYREFVDRPPERKIRSWLVRLARAQLAEEVRRRTTERERTVRIEEDVPETPPNEAVSTLGDEILDFYEPDEDLKLGDVIPDLDLPTPEEEAEVNELRRCVSAAVAGLPRQWRVILLRHAQGLTNPAPDVQRILELARAYLRQRLLESGCVGPPGRSGTPSGPRDTAARRYSA